MITSISLRHFKCFSEIDLALKNLTLLTGLNSSGKSTIIQSILLLHQTINEDEDGKNLILNGKNVSLGTSKEVINKISGRKFFSIGIASERIHIYWKISSEFESPAPPIVKISWKAIDDINSRVSISGDSVPMIPKDEDIVDLSLTDFEMLFDVIRRINYISADRIGPREIYPSSNVAQQIDIGSRGEYVPWFIHQYENVIIPTSLCLPDTPPTLKRQAEAWLQSFFPGSGMLVEPILRTNLLTMSLRTNESTNYHRPINVGYGISYVLPIITACLGSAGFANQGKQKNLVIIENPELHLHPAGQSLMGIFLARVASSGTQVIVETHSDHVLNGVRRAVKGVDTKPILAPEDVAIHFFQAYEQQEDRTHVISPNINRFGKLDKWPMGFFDQFDKDMDSLIDW